ncbi:hypothetical protein BUALT_Bualt12G0096800 [Buddleja alternifolia]|uniref:Mitochondrial phosphate carrier protein n=1 Tax=Buddleja alternifolia TaxID=168488 RepID=A0AAV6X0N7_9LAMI|nr:hypothetical protein BUALT_Bualt12G0096800 [Buddleja alternifolia]
MPLGGILSGGLTHMALTPLDLVKANMQVFEMLLRKLGVQGFFRGWVPTLLGYSAQGACKFGFYEFFKKYYCDFAGPENASKYKTLIYLAGSASAEVIADIALCPLEAVRVRVQTQPGFARGLSDGFPKFVRSEGALGFYKGLVPLWGRQIPCKLRLHIAVLFFCCSLYLHIIVAQSRISFFLENICWYGILQLKDINRFCLASINMRYVLADCGIVGPIWVIFLSNTMMKFASFETIVELIYKHAILRPKSECSENLQVRVSVAGGFIAGVFCAVAVKHLGLWGLFTRGLPLRILTIGTLTGSQWGIYDAFKVSVGLPTIGGIFEELNI